MTAKITNHVERALARRIQKLKGKPSFTAFLTSLVQQAQPLEDAIYQLLVERQIDTAIEVQLNAIGSLVGQPRNGLPDDDYRRLVRARISVNRSNGRVSDVLTVAKLVIDDIDALLKITQEFPASVCLEVQDVITPSSTADLLIPFLRDTVAAGVRIILKTSADVAAEMFTFAKATFLDGAVIATATSLTVTSTAGFPLSGSLDLSTGLAVAETVTYTVTDGVMFAVSATANAHADGAAVSLSGSPGKGFSDDVITTQGGKFADAVV